MTDDYIEGKMEEVGLVGAVKGGVAGAPAAASAAAEGKLSLVNPLQNHQPPISRLGELLDML